MIWLKEGGGRRGILHSPWWLLRIYIHMILCVCVFSSDAEIEKNEKRTASQAARDNSEEGVCRVARRKVCPNLSGSLHRGWFDQGGWWGMVWQVNEYVCVCVCLWECVCIEWCYTSEPSVGKKETHGRKAVLHSLVFASERNGGLLTLFGVSQRRPWLLAFSYKRIKKKIILFFSFSFLLSVL